MYIVVDKSNKVIFQSEMQPLAISSGLALYSVSSIPNVPNGNHLYFDGTSFSVRVCPKKQESYEQKVEKLIRQKYSVSDELAILRQRDTKPNEFAEYFTYAEQCKSIAKTDLV